MRFFIVLSVLFVLSAASFGGKRRRDHDGDDRSVYPKIEAESDKSGLVEKDETALFPFSELPVEIQQIIVNFLGNKYAKMAQVSRLYYEWTRVQHRYYLVSRLSAKYGVPTVLHQFEISFEDQKHCQLRDDIIAYLVPLVRWCRQNFPHNDIDGENAREPLNLFLQFERPVAEVYDLLFGRGAYKDKLIPDDFLHLQRLFAGDAGLLAALICSSDEHLDDLHALLSIEMVTLTVSKCQIMANVLMGSEKFQTPMGPLKVLADSMLMRAKKALIPIAPLKILADSLLMETRKFPIQTGPLRESADRMLMKARKDPSPMAPLKILADSMLTGTGKVPIATGSLKVLADSIHPNLLEITFGLNSNASFAVIIYIHNWLKTQGGQCEILAHMLSEVVKNRHDLSVANEMFLSLRFPCLQLPETFSIENYLLDHKFIDRHHFSLEQCAKMLSRTPMNLLLDIIMFRKLEVTPHIRKLMLSVFGGDLEGVPAEWQLQFHVLILQDLTTFSKWGEVRPTVFAEIAMDSNLISTFLTTDQKSYILSIAAPTLLNSTSQDELMLNIYFYLNGCERWNFIPKMSPTQMRAALDIVLHSNLEYEVVRLFDMGNQSVIIASLLAYVNEHPDYVPHVYILPLLYLYSSNDAFRERNRGLVKRSDLELAFSNTSRLFCESENRAAQRRLTEFHD